MKVTIYDWVIPIVVAVILGLTVATIVNGCALKNTPKIVQENPDVLYINENWDWGTDAGYYKLERVILK